MYLVLIDNRIQDIDSIIQSFTENTEYVLFHFRIDTIADIQSRITKNYESVAIIQHNYGMDVYRFVFDNSNAMLTDVETADPNLESWGEYIGFLRWLKTERGAKYVDLLACDLWADSNWRYIIETVRARDDIYIRASLDRTGAGGDFILESDNVDMVGIYFTDTILEYKYAFFSFPFPNPIWGYTNYYPYKLPTTNTATMNSGYDTYITEFGSPTTPSMSNVILYSSNGRARAVLKADGTVTVYGLANYGGVMPCGIVTQSQLVNITKIVGGTELFIALKNDGTVVCWGKPNTGYGALDINVASPDPNVISVDSVRSQLVDVVDVFANGYDMVAALTSSGKLIIFGCRNNGGTSSAVSQLSSGVAKVFTGYSYFVILKANGVAIVHYSGGTGNYMTSTYFSNSKPITDVLIDAWNPYPLFVRQNGASTEIVRFTGELVYTVSTGVTILRKVIYSYSYQGRFFLVLSNKTIVYIYYINSFNSVVFTNATDIVASDGTYAMIKDNAVVLVRGTTTTYPTLGGSGSNFPVRLVIAAANAVGCIWSDNAFGWDGTIGNYSSSTMPTTLPSVYNATLTNVVSVYATNNTFILSKNNGTYVIIPGNTTASIVSKTASVNVFFEPTFYGAVALKIPYAPTVTPTSINQNTSTMVSYYVSNPDLMAYVGRRYCLYYNSTLIDTFYPSGDTHTYIFNVNTAATGTVTLNIKDETNNFVYTVASFQLTVVAIGFSYSYTPISLYSPTGVFDLSYADQYTQVFTSGITYSLKDSNNNVLQTAIVNAPSYSITFQNASSATLRYGPNALQMYDGETVVGNPITINAVCFREGTRILCMDKRTSKPKYIPIEKMKPGTLVKTLHCGFVPVKLIGHSTISNSDSDKRMRDSLYKCSRAQYPELIDDLYITGNHSILIRELSEKQRADLLRECGEIYMTEGQFRLPAWLDTRTERFQEPGVFRIWHFALENHDYFMNYGIYANGLLVETTSLRFMNELAGMKLIE